MKIEVVPNSLHGLRGRKATFNSNIAGVQLENIPSKPVQFKISDIYELEKAHNPTPHPVSQKCLSTFSLKDLCVLIVN